MRSGGGRLFAAEVLLHLPTPDVLLKVALGGAGRKIHHAKSIETIQIGLRQFKQQVLKRRGFIFLEVVFAHKDVSLSCS